MQSLKINEDGSYRVEIGAVIDKAIVEAIEIAGKSGKEVRFCFNGRSFVVCGDSDASLLRRDFDRAIWGFVTVIGPYPGPYTDEQRMLEEAKMKGKSTKPVEKKEAFVLDKFEISDEAGWGKFSDCQTKSKSHMGIVRYAARWAKLMESRLANGERLQDVAIPTSHEADHEGMSGSAFSFAVSALVKYWKYGYELREVM